MQYTASCGSDCECVLFFRVATCALMDSVPFRVQQLLGHIRCDRVLPIVQLATAAAADNSIFASFPQQTNVLDHENAAEHCQPLQLIQEALQSVVYNPAWAASLAECLQVLTGPAAAAAMPQKCRLEVDLIDAPRGEMKACGSCNSLLIVTFLSALCHP